MKVKVQKIKWHEDCDGKDNDGLTIPSEVEIDIEQPAWNENHLIHTIITRKLEGRYGWTVEDYDYELE